MEQPDGIDAEQIYDDFLCCICLDLLYKPVALACGHVCCFWCVNRSMSGLHESHCPICRHPYHHFPTICEMLHFLLLKMYPVAYKRRENQILEEEKEIGFFSPELDDLLGAPLANKELDHLDNQAQSFTKSTWDNLSAHPSINRNGDPYANMGQSERAPVVQDNGSCTIELKEKRMPQRNCNGTWNQVSVDDVLCPACKQLLFRPVVLNCGHVFCEACIIPSDETIRCHVCQNMDPSGFLKVVLQLDHLLEEKFPMEHAARKATVQLRQIPFPCDTLSTCSKKACKEKGFLHWLGDHGSKVHIGAGCDYCGMYPIIGDRYKCKDCKEAVGFDLCGDCYNTKSKRPGRFNQRHTPDHRFEIVKSSAIRNILLGLLRGQLEGGGSTPAILSDDTSENPEDQENHDTENGEIVLLAPRVSNDAVEHKDDDDTQPLHDTQH
ncbi:E3 ubiquitin-protein ligase PRT1 [Diospyros lotus]|uniref:E3 ubiquitin-protein ligase PRT1 n=1 Tax=Diospyros lotus TaxID=55363 RepID=UPI002253DCDB|nr:E3 ubiquitin-protein ligase PRT1 [Diospyros lotus]